MDGFDHFSDDNMIIKVENNSDAMAKIKKLFRIVEIFLILVFLTWASTRLPFAVRISGEYFRRLLNVIFSSLFIFLVSNVIVLTLFFKSRHLFQQHDDHSQVISSEIQLDFCEDFVKSCYAVDDRPEETVTFEDKQTIFEVKKDNKKALVRSQSDRNLEREKSCGKQLRRTETEKRRRDGGEMVDELSNEEFQRAIESFIAKQIMFHKQEKLPIVLHASPTTMPNYN